MEQITVEKEDLLKILRANLAEHREIFIEALDGYGKAFIREIETMLEAARKGDYTRRAVTLVKPLDQTKDYERAIRMLEMTVDKTIKLSEEDFRDYVMNEWHWRSQWVSSNMEYSPKVRTMVSEGKV